MTRGNRIITLLTDFGTKDHYVGVMKGVIAGIAPKAQVIDISHEIEPFQVSEARFLLKQSWPYFPKGTVHVCVVDPGVGGARRALCVEAGGHLFVGPDNGLFTDLLQLKGARTREITSVKFMLKNVSQTFHGRDVFAPSAAHMSAGVPPARAGKLVHDATRLPGGEPLRTGRRFWQGEVAHIDRFGNAVTNLEAAEFLPLAVKGFKLNIGFKTVTKLVRSYEEASAGEPVAIVGSAGTLEVSIKEAAAAKKLGIGVGAPVELEVW